MKITLGEEIYGSNIKVYTVYRYRDRLRRAHLLSIISATTTPMVLANSERCSYPCDPQAIFSIIGGEDIAEAQEHVVAKV